MGPAIAVVLVLTATGCTSGLPWGREGAADRVAASDVATTVADGTATPSDATAPAAQEAPITDPAELAEYIDVPGEPVGVWFWSIPRGVVETNTRVPGPTDYLFYAVIEYGSPAEAADAAGPAAEQGSDEILADNWYPQQLLDVSRVGQWDRPWLDVTVHTPISAWADPVYVIDDAPTFIVVNYRDPTS